MFQYPMSSPMMTRMFGFCCCAEAGAGAIATVARVASRPVQMLPTMRMIDPFLHMTRRGVFDRVRTRQMPTVGRQNGRMPSQGSREEFSASRGGAILSQRADLGIVTRQWRGGYAAITSL